MFPPTFSIKSWHQTGAKEKPAKRSRHYNYGQRMGQKNHLLRLWLMDDQLYDTTNFGLEAEWFYLSDGKRGRIIEPTIWNYTSFLNNWVLGS